jgi:CBS domain-containing protein
MGAIGTAGEICQRDVHVAFGPQAIDEAARAMRDARVGCLVVVDETAAGRMLVGVLTDRDIVTAVVAESRDAATLRVAEVMTRDVATVRESDSLHQVIALMNRRRVRRVPVTDSQQRLVGVVSSDDVFRLVAGELQALAAAIGEQLRLERPAEG